MTNLRNTDYGTLQMMRSQAHREARTQGWTAIDLQAVEREIAIRDTYMAIAAGEGIR